MVRPDAGGSLPSTFLEEVFLGGEFEVVTRVRRYDFVGVGKALLEEVSLGDGI